MKRMLFYLLILSLVVPMILFGQTFEWRTHYATFDDGTNGTGDQTSSVAVLGPNIFVALVSGTPNDVNDIFNTLDDNYMVGYWDADSALGRVTPAPYGESGLFDIWSAALDQISLNGAWQMVGGKNNWIYVANNDANHNILVFELSQFGILSTDYRMETGTENIFAIEVDTAGYVYVVDYEGRDDKTNEVKIFAPIGAAGTTWDVIGGHTDTPVSTIDLPVGIYQGVTVSSDGTQLFVSASSERNLWKFIGDPISGYTKDDNFSITLAEDDTVETIGSIKPTFLGLAYHDQTNYVFATADTFLSAGNLGGYPYGRIYVIDGETAASLDTIDIAQWNFDITGVYNTGSNNGRVGGFTSVCDVDIEPTESAVYTQTYYGWAVEKWIYDGVLNVEKKSDIIPTEFSLKQNYPNPFSAGGGSAFGGNPSTTIEFEVTKTVNVSLSVYNLAGQLVTTLVNEELAPSAYTTTFNASNLPSGIYFYILQAGQFKLQKKMILTK